MDTFQKNPQALPKNVAQKFLEALKKQKEYAIFYCVRTAAHAAMLHKMDSELYAAIENHPQAKDLQREVYAYGLKYGRDRVIPKIKEIAEKGDQVLTMAAMTALRDFYNYTDREKGEICDWVGKFTQDENNGIARYSAYILAGRCKGKYIDQALDAAEKRAAAGKLDNFYVYDAAPFSCKGLFKSKEANPERCKRRAALRKKVGIKD